MSETLTIVLPPPIPSRPRRGITVHDGIVTEGFALPSPCDHCRKPIEAGSGIRKVFHSWMHDACARDAIGKLGVSESWLMLAEQLAARPGAFKVAEIRAIVRALIEMAPVDFDADPWAPAGLRSNGEAPE